MDDDRVDRDTGNGGLAEAGSSGSSRPHRASPSTGSARRAGRDGAMSRIRRIFRPGRMLLLAAALVTPAAPGRAETTLDKIERTGTLVAGTRDGVPPFAFRDGEGTFRGFSVDILSAIHEALEKRLGKPISLDLRETTAGDRFSRIQSGELAIVCDITTPTWEREDIVDFSVTIFFNGTRILVDRGHSMGDIGSLKSPVVGVVASSSTIKGLKNKVPSAQLVPFPSVQDAFVALEMGKVDAVAHTDVILRSLQRHASRPGRYSLLPINDYLSTEAIACILPENDSHWRDFTNRVITDLLQGVDAYRGDYYEIHRKWFGAASGIHLPLSKDAINHFKNVIEFYGD
ncbi:amino acid ABC transporter substrate-binding protein [Pseudochelatococcus sp. B33]